VSWRALSRLESMDARVSLLTWMVGFNLALSVAMLLKVFGR
jgi:hypothetical protein